MTLCPGSLHPATSTTRVVMGPLNVTIKTHKCPFCDQRVLVVQGRMIEHQTAQTNVGGIRRRLHAARARGGDALA